MFSFLSCLLFSFAFFSYPTAPPFFIDTLILVMPGLTWCFLVTPLLICLLFCYSDFMCSKRVKCTLLAHQCQQEFERAMFQKRHFKPPGHLDTWSFRQNLQIKDECWMLQRWTLHVAKMNAAFRVLTMQRVSICLIAGFWLCIASL